MTAIIIGGLLLLGVVLFAGIKYLASSDHSRAHSEGGAGDHFSPKDPGTGDPGPGH
jgi:hypothetical protein